MLEEQRPDDVEALGETVVEADLRSVGWEARPILAMSHHLLVRDQGVVALEEKQVALERLGGLVGIERRDVREPGGAHDVVEHAHQRAGRKEPDDPEGKDAEAHSTNKTHYRFISTASDKQLLCRLY
jgi:hypothetical protein